MNKFLDSFGDLDSFIPVLRGFATSAIAAIIILIIGVIIARWMRKRVRGMHLLDHAQVDATLRPVLASVVFYVIIAMTLYAVLIRLGVPATSLLAVFGAAGLAVGLALKDTLANIAAGVMLLALRPLSVGDFIDVNGVAGTVVEIGLFTTTIKNGEGVFIYMPNSNIWGNRIQNFGRHSQRKLIIDIGVGYDSDLEQVRRVMLDVLNATPNLMTEPTPPEAYVMGFGDNAITMSARGWLPADNWLERSSDVRVRMKTALDQNQIDIPFPQRVVHMRAETPSDVG